MGMFDFVRFEAPLPLPAEVDADQAKSFVFQTKDLCQRMDTFTITADGRLVGEQYDVEDRSDPNAGGFDRLVGCMTRVNRRPQEWRHFTGEVRFYTSYGPRTKSGSDAHWIAFSSYFIDGKMQSVTLAEHERDLFFAQSKFEKLSSDVGVTAVPTSLEIHSRDGTPIEPGSPEAENRASAMRAVMANFNYTVFRNIKAD